MSEWNMYTLTVLPHKATLICPSI